MKTNDNRRVLIIDDNESIHADFCKIIGAGSQRGAELDSAAAALFGESSTTTAAQQEFELDSAYQGEQGLSRVQQSIEQGRPYAGLRRRTDAARLGWHRNRAQALAS